MIDLMFKRMSSHKTNHSVNRSSLRYQLLKFKRNRLNMSSNALIFQVNKITRDINMYNSFVPNGPNSGELRQLRSGLRAAVGLTDSEGVYEPPNIDIDESVVEMQKWNIKGAITLLRSMSERAVISGGVLAENGRIITTIIDLFFESASLFPSGTPTGTPPGSPQLPPSPDN